MAASDTRSSSASEADGQRSHMLLFRDWLARVDGGGDMTDLQGVIGLLYRANWTRLSLSADTHSEIDQDLRMSRVRAIRPSWAPEGRIWRIPVVENTPLTWEEATSEELEGYNSWDTALLIAPGRRYRQEYRDEPSGRVIGSDGERSWVWRAQDPAPPEPPVDVGPKPPLRHLFCPSELLERFALEVRGPLTSCGRDAIAVVATPRTSTEPLSRLRAGSLSDRLEVIVDAELGILFRYEETFEGQRLSLTELTAVTLDPPEAADASRFTPPPGSQIGRNLRESVRETSSGPGSDAAKIVSGLAADVIGASIRFASHRPGRQNSSEGDLQAAMPLAEPAVLQTEGGPPPPDDLLYLLYRSGDNPSFTATVDHWNDRSALAAQISDSARAAGRGGMGFFLDSVNAMTHEEPVTHMVSRVRVSGRNKYRVDRLAGLLRNQPETIICDGEHRWQISAAQTVVGPADPMSGIFANLADSSWLLGCRLSGGAEISYRGRRAYQLRAVKYGDGWQAKPQLFFPADVIVDAELGCVLRQISFAGARPASLFELSAIDTEPIPDEEFRPDIPPGVRVVEQTGNPFTDMPGAAGTAVRTAADVVRRTSDAVSATRSFLDDLLGRSRS
ncbi:MAG: LolA family protein [Streptosporangiaceae bacterium]